MHSQEQRVGIRSANVGRLAAGVLRCSLESTDQIAGAPSRTAFRGERATHRTAPTSTRLVQPHMDGVSRCVDVAERNPRPLLGSRPRLQLKERAERYEIGVRGIQVRHEPSHHAGTAAVRRRVVGAKLLT